MSFFHSLYENRCSQFWGIAEQFTTETDFQDFSHCMTPSLSLFLNDQLEPWRSAGDEIKVEVESVQANLVNHKNSELKVDFF